MKFVKPKFSRSDIFIFIGAILILLVSFVVIPLTTRNKETVNLGKEIIAKKDFEGWSLLTVENSKNPSYWAVPYDVSIKYKVGDLFDGESWSNDYREESIKVLKLIEDQERNGKVSLLKEIELTQKDKDLEELEELMNNTKSMKPIIVPGS
jgi:hypothetical protein